MCYQWPPNSMQAQADRQADAVRKKLEAKRQLRVAAVSKALSPPVALRAVREEEGGDQASLRKVWGAPPSGGGLPLMAWQVDATGVITGGSACMCVCVWFG